MPREERLPVNPPIVPTSARSPSVLLLLVVVLTVGSAEAFFFTGTTLLSPLALPLLLLIAGTVFVLKSYRGQAPSKFITANEGASQEAREQHSHAPVASLSPPLSLSPSPESKTICAVDSTTPSARDSLAIDFNVRTTVEETVSRFTAVAKQKGIELSCLFSSDSPVPFRGDPGELRLILLNLLDYAVSSITAGEVVVRRVLVEQTATHATFRFSVSSMQTTLSVSSPSALVFPSSDNNPLPTVPSREAAGLALSKQIVKNWGGEFGFEKSLNFGTTVWFTLTLKKQPLHVFSDLVPRDNLSGTRVLVVSDEFSLSEADVHTWGLASHRLSPSSPVYSTLTTAAQEGGAYDILLLHCQSLDVDTLAFAARIRTTEALGTLRLVLLVNWGRKGDAQKVRHAGFDAYITNPVSSTLLFECFTTLLGQPPYALTPNLPLVTRYTLAEARMRGRTRILIVESSLPEQKHDVRLVEELGYHAVIAATAREAIEFSTRLPYAAVLLPAQKPGIDGIAAAEQIRHFDRKEGVHTPLIGIVSGQNDHEREQCLAVGMDTVVERPLRAESLVEAIQHCRTSSAVPRESLAVSSQTENTFAQLNLHEALARIEGDKELFDEMTASFVKEYPKTLMKMREAVTRHDATVLAYNANALTGALENFAATQAIHTALQLEDMGRQEDFSLASPTLAALEKQLTHVHAQLMDFQLQATA